MVIWCLKHLAVLFKWKMTFHSGIRNWKHQAEMVQKQSRRITIHLINDLNIKSERVLRDKMCPFTEQRIGMSPASGTLRMASLQEELCRVCSHPGKARSLFQSPENVLNSILMSSGVGEAEKAPIQGGFSVPFPVPLCSSWLPSILPGLQPQHIEGPSTPKHPGTPGVTNQHLCS